MRLRGWKKAESRVGFSWRGVPGRATHDGGAPPFPARPPRLGSRKRVVPPSSAGRLAGYATAAGSLCATFLMKKEATIEMEAQVPT